MGLIENIRNKPHEHKIRIIWVCAAGVVVVLLVVWVLVGRLELNPEQSLFQNLKTQAGESAKSFPNPFSN